MRQKWGVNKNFFAPPPTFKTVVPPLYETAYIVGLLVHHTDHIHYSTFSAKYLNQL